MERGSKRPDTPKIAQMTVRAAVRWTLRQQSAWPYEIEIPRTDGFYVGDTGWWYEESGDANQPVQLVVRRRNTRRHRVRVVHYQHGDPRKRLRKQRL